MSDCAAPRAGQQGRRPHLYHRQRRCGAGRRLWRRHRVRVVSDHPVFIARRSVYKPLPALSHRPRDQEKALCDHPGRRRTGVNRRGDRRRMERRARLTATSGPGISLMQEFIGLAYFAEIPAVIFDGQRGGRSTGMPTRTQQADVLSCAYASHGDTKHVLLFPEDPGECFHFAATALDLADRLQTPIFVMLDLDIGMNERLTAPFAWDETRRFDRGKVMTAEELEAGKEFGRYLDVDGDGIPYRTYPGTHPRRGAFFTRGTTKDRYAKYTEEGGPYVDNMQRLLRKFDTAKRLAPAPIEHPAAEPTQFGAIFYGSTSPAMHEALDMLARQGLALDALRIRAFPFHDDVAAFIAAHDQIVVVEQNRDGQLRTLLVNELGIDPGRLVPILHYDGTPITARFIARAVADRMAGLRIVPLRKAVP